MELLVCACSNSFLGTEPRVFVHPTRAGSKSSVYFRSSLLIWAALRLIAIERESNKRRGALLAARGALSSGVSVSRGAK